LRKQGALTSNVAKLLAKFKKAKTLGLTAKEMGLLFFGAEDVLSDRDIIRWDWTKRLVNEEPVWVKVARIVVK